MKIFVVAPVYFDVPAFKILRERARAVLKNYQVQFLVIDDSGENDSQVAELRKDSDTRVFVVPFNMGNQRTFVYALRKIANDLLSDDIVVTLDGDGEDMPEHIPLLVEKLLQSAQKNTVVFAQRTRRHDPLWFQVGYRFFRAIFRALIGTTITTGNFAAFRGQFVRTYLRHPHFDLAFAGALVSVNSPKAFVPCERGRRYAGESKMTYLGLSMHAIRMFMPFLDRISIRLALLSLFLSTCSGLGLVLERLQVSEINFPNWTSSLLSGVFVVSSSFFVIAALLFVQFMYNQSLLMRGFHKE